MKHVIKALRGETQNEDQRVLLAPAVGFFSQAPPIGTHLIPGADAGALQVLTTTHRMIVPRRGGGVVQEILVARGLTPVDYGQPLLALSLSADLSALDLETPLGAAAAAADEEDVPEGAIAIRSPTDGIFYRRPAPDEPCFAEEGAEVERGAVLGLVEVMKCFNQVTYASELEIPRRARVRRIFPADGGEVGLNQLLFLLDPA